MKLLVVRHGECEANVRGIAAGSGIDSLLTEHGREQAQTAAERLSSQRPRTIISSPLRRAVDTAVIIRDAVVPGQQIIVDEAFTERNVGDATGQPLEVYAELERAHKPMPGGETDQALYDRLGAGFERLKLLPEPVVLVTHNGAYRMLYCILNQRPMHDFRLSPSIMNGEIQEFEI